MRSVILILIALFFNFFGFYIIDSYLWSEGILRSHPFQPNHFTYFSLIERSIILCICLLAAIGIISQRRAPPPNASTLIAKESSYYLISLILIISSIYNLINLDSFDAIAARGIDQKYVTAESAMTRMAILLVPAFLFYNIHFFKFKSARFISIMFMVSIMIGSIYSGDRRLVFYYILTFCLFFFSYQKKVGAKVPIIKYILAFAAIFCFFFAIYYVRYLFSPGSGDADPIFLVLQSTLGALGIGEVLPAVEQIVASGGGFLHGESFIGYVVNLFIPTPMILYFNIPFDFIRPALAFDALVNSNPNTGYDFMMLADFYWNFGYFGYIIYISIFILICYYAIKWQDNLHYKKFPVYVILVVFYIAGQRSDFGLFMKSSIYCILFYSLMNFIFIRRDKMIARTA